LKSLSKSYWSYCNSHLSIRNHSCYTVLGAHSENPSDAQDESAIVVVIRTYRYFVCTLRYIEYRHRNALQCTSVPTAREKKYRYRTEDTRATSCSTKNRPSSGRDGPIHNQGSIQITRDQIPAHPLELNFRQGQRREERPRRGSQSARPFQVPRR